MADQDKTQGAKSNWKSTTIEYGKSILIAIVLALVIRASRIMLHDAENEHLPMG